MFHPFWVQEELEYVVAVNQASQEGHVPTSNGPFLLAGTLQSEDLGFPCEAVVNHFTQNLVPWCGTFLRELMQMPDS